MLEIIKIDGAFSVCKASELSGAELTDDFVFIGKTDEELSLVCRTQKVPENASEREDGWRLMRIGGVLDFSLIGVISNISAILAKNNIGIFVVSTFNTDYILVKEESYERALRALSDGGYRIAR